MKDFLYYIVSEITEIHELVLRLNDKYEYNLSDKSLHFLIIGALGLFLVFIIHPIFKLLVRKGHVIAITWIYVFTLIVVITFAIEIGQKVTNTGKMEFADIMFGVVGFIVMFVIFMLFRFAWLGIMKLRRMRKKRNK